MGRYVRTIDIDQDEAARRAASEGGEFFAFRCATCGRVYLAEARAAEDGEPRVYPDPADLTARRALIDDWLVCVGCSTYIEAAAIDAARRGDPSAESWRVFRDEMAQSRWAWALRANRNE